MDYKNLGPVWVIAERLTNFNLPLIKKMLEESGEFFPHALALTQEDNVEAVVGLPSPELKDDLEETLKSLESAIKRGTLEGRYKAVAEMRNAFVHQPIQTKAIRVLFEHESGIALEIFRPYERSTTGEFKLSEPIWKYGEKRYFKNQSH